MSFKNYLVNMGIDAVLLLGGMFAVVSAFFHFAQGNSIPGVVFLALGVLSLLYTRYRAKKKKITY